MLCSINNWQVAGISFLRLLLPATIDDVFSLVRNVLQNYAVQGLFSEGERLFAEKLRLAVREVPHHTIFSPVASLPLPFRSSEETVAVSGLLHR